LAREVKQPAFIVGRDGFDKWWDFENFATGTDGVTSALTAGASALATDALAGVLTLGTGATANNEAVVRSTQALWQIAFNRPLIAECRLQYAEAAVNQANVAFGLADSTGLGWMQAASAGPRASGNQVMIYKQGGGTVWRAQSRNGTQVFDQVSTVTAGGTSYTILRVEVKDMSTTQATVTYTVDGVPLRDAVTGIPFSHSLNLAGSALLRVLAYLNCGSATAEGASIDYFGASQVRF